MLTDSNRWRILKFQHIAAPDTFSSPKNRILRKAEQARLDFPQTYTPCTLVCSCVSRLQQLVWFGDRPGRPSVDRKGSTHPPGFFRESEADFSNPLLVAGACGPVV